MRPIDEAPKFYRHSIWYWKTQQCSYIFPNSTTGWHNPIQNHHSLFVNIDKVVLKAYGNKPHVLSCTCNTSIWKWKQEAHEFKASLHYIVISKTNDLEGQAAGPGITAKPDDLSTFPGPRKWKEGSSSAMLSSQHMSHDALIHTCTEK